MKKEIRIGLLGITALLLFYFGMKFLQGKDITNSSNYFYVEYDTIDRLQVSAPVSFRGMEVGSVYQINMKEDLSKIVVTITVQKRIAIPKNTIVEIISTGITGGREINLVMSGDCRGDGCAVSGDYLKGVTKGLLASLASVDNVKEYTDKLNEGLSETMDSLSAKLKNDKELNEAMSDLKSTITNLKMTTQRLDGLMRASSGSIEHALRNLDDITTGINAKNDKIAAMLDNAAGFMQKLNEADIKGITGKTNDAIAMLDKTLKSTDQTIAGLSSLVNHLNNGQGTLGKLLHDDDFYNQLKSATLNLDLLMEDIRIHPKRYTRILSRKEIPYEKN